MRYGIWILLVTLVVGVAGCGRSTTYRAQRPTPYDRFDPFPDASMGPDTGGRPREFVQQREKPRRDVEGRMFASGFAPPSPPAPGIPVGPPPAQPNVPTYPTDGYPYNTYPQSIRE